MLLEHERYSGLGMDALARERYYGLGVDALAKARTRTWKNAMCSLCNSFDTPNHAGHIRRGRPSMHLLRVYAPAEPISITISYS